MGNASVKQALLEHVCSCVCGHVWVHVHGCVSACVCAHIPVWQNLYLTHPSLQAAPPHPSSSLRTTRESMWHRDPYKCTASWGHGDHSSHAPGAGITFTERHEPQLGLGTHPRGLDAALRAQLAPGSDGLDFTDSPAVHPTRTVSYPLCERSTKTCPELPRVPFPGGCNSRPSLLG